MLAAVLERSYLMKRLAPAEGHLTPSAYLIQLLNFMKIIWELKKLVIFSIPKFLNEFYFQKLK